MSYRYLAVLIVTALWGCSSSSDENTGSSGGTGPSGAGGGSALGTGGAGGLTNGSSVTSVGGSTNAASSTTSCTGQEVLCAKFPFGLCTEVQMSLGHCVDWSQVGATPCTSPADCPATQPTAHFAGEPGAAMAICVKATTVEYTTIGNSIDTGYCAALQTATDATGVADCSTNPCGVSAATPGYCSYIRNGAGATVTSCTWPI